MKDVVVSRFELAGGNVRMPDINSILMNSIKAKNPSFISLFMIIIDHLTTREA